MDTLNLKKKTLNANIQLFGLFDSSIFTFSLRCSFAEVEFNVDVLVCSHVHISYGIQFWKVVWPSVSEMNGSNVEIKIIAIPLYEHCAYMFRISKNSIFA